MQTTNRNQITNIIDGGVKSATDKVVDIQVDGATALAVQADKQLLAVGDDYILKSTEVNDVEQITQSNYTVLSPKVATTLYLIIG